MTTSNMQWKMKGVGRSVTHRFTLISSKPQQGLLYKPAQERFDDRALSTTRLGYHEALNEHRAVAQNGELTSLDYIGSTQTY